MRGSGAQQKSLVCAETGAWKRQPMRFEKGRARGSRLIFKAITHEMQSEETRLFALRNAVAKEDLSQTKIIFIAGTLLGLLITGAAGFIVQRDGVRRGDGRGTHLLKAKRNIDELIDGVQDYAIFMMGPLGEIRQLERLVRSKSTGCTWEEVAGQNYSRFFPPRISRAAGRKKCCGWLPRTACMKIKACACARDGTRFLIRSTLHGVAQRGRCSYSASQRHQPRYQRN